MFVQFMGVYVSSDHHHCLQVNTEISRGWADMAVFSFVTSIITAFGEMLQYTAMVQFNCKWSLLCPVLYVVGIELCLCNCDVPALSIITGSIALWNQQLSLVTPSGKRTDTQMK